VTRCFPKAPGEMSVCNAFSQERREQVLYSVIDGLLRAGAIKQVRVVFMQLFGFCQCIKIGGLPWYFVQGFFVPMSKSYLLSQR